ncbi:MAG TPA: sugar porter family MFS transporter [Gordonia polyisoprenivorans]|uniref:Sugar porter family MFS transporter n=1 Tax=Gordonia polyisoprenivorans TaxID=84595 RepID=A0A846WNW8_9ACTN|nr:MULTISPECIES: sugar porter family MFS transporter [Gordonia]MDF3282358.1 sugar porter family MFS transporter [Gordonia sp. N1V]NKY01931.1 sugar porter family MFS transporter [Gordonia polyisoprenivorans]UZF54866.1 sugar porter family MFS transporter [Gordonia polyisoprenivorans]GAB23698.1 putative sugar transporter [Gordonia polyisoprenivorans NBRC 16320 = JCM 10675]HCS57388.1 sugar porter family MFS transporter [Gordonia polyisoprenivorans]
MSTTTSAASNRRFLTKLTVIATLGGLLFGYDTGVISGALLYMKDDLHLSAFGEATVVSALLFPGAAFGALFGGRVADRLGRKRTLLLCGLVFLVGAVGCALAPNVAIMVIARIILGLGVGAAAVTCPLYLAEMAPAERRGRMVTINELMIVTGQMLAFAMNALLDHIVTDPHVWRVMLAVAAVPAVALLLGMLALPDSPRWYALKGRLDESRNVLGRSRTPDEADAEYATIVDHITHMRGGRTPLSVVRDVPWIRRIVLIGCGLAIIQQATGINTVNYYAPTILEQSGLGVSAALIATIAVGVTSVVTTIIGIILLGYIGRRTMLLIGFSGVAITQAALALAFLLPQTTSRSYIILACMVAFVAFVQMFIGTCVWLLLSEIFPLSVRGFAMGIAVFVLWCTNALISFLFPVLNSALGSTGTFGLFVLVNLASLAFVYRSVPETKGITLEGLEEHLEAHHDSRSPAAVTAAA